MKSIDKLNREEEEYTDYKEQWDHVGEDQESLAPSSTEHPTLDKKK